jgi:hypothetical protein
VCTYTHIHTYIHTYIGKELSKEIEADLATCMQNMHSHDESSAGFAGALSQTDEADSGGGGGRGGRDEDAAAGGDSSALEEEEAEEEAAIRAATDAPSIDDDLERKIMEFRLRCDRRRAKVPMPAYAIFALSSSSCVWLSAPAMPTSGGSDDGAGGQRQGLGRGALKKWKNQKCEKNDMKTGGSEDGAGG